MPLRVAPPPKPLCTQQSICNQQSAISNLQSQPSAGGPLESFAHDRRRWPVRPLVFAVGDVVAEAFQAWNEAPARVVDRHHRIADAVRDEDFWLAPRRH